MGRTLYIDLKFVHAHTMLNPTAMLWYITIDHMEFVVVSIEAFPAIAAELDITNNLAPSRNEVVILLPTRQKS